MEEIIDGIKLFVTERNDLNAAGKVAILSMLDSIPIKTLRDEFAMAVTPALASCGDVWPSDSDMLEIARRSYVLADAMMIEREKSRTKEGA